MVVSMDSIMPQLDLDTSRVSAPPPAWLDAVADTGTGGRSALGGTTDLQHC
jgi:hypothetical protein